MRHFFSLWEMGGDAKFKDRNRAINCSTLSVIAVVQSAYQKEIFLSLWPWLDLDLDFQGQGHETSSRPIQQKKDHWPITYRYGDICIRSLHMIYRPYVNFKSSYLSNGWRYLGETLYIFTPLVEIFHLKKWSLLYLVPLRSSVIIAQGSKNF